MSPVNPRQITLIRCYSRFRKGLDPRHPSTDRAFRPSSRAILLTGRSSFDPGGALTLTVFVGKLTEQLGQRRKGTGIGLFACGDLLHARVRLLSNDRLRG